MVTLPAGEFLMGSTESDAEQPMHKVKVAAFKLAKYDVTTKEFMQFIKATDYKPTKPCLVKAQKGALEEHTNTFEADTFADREFHPITCLGWEDTQAYITWLSTQTNKRYRLPSEAEWEYAARAGSTKKFHFGDDEKKLCQYGNVYDKSTSEVFGSFFQWSIKGTECEDDEPNPSIVGTYPPNKFGLYDMVGNASQWVADCYHSNYQGAPQTSAAWTDANCTTPFARGGTRLTGANSQRPAFRPTANDVNAIAKQGYFDRGFRLALDIRDDIKDYASAQPSELQKNFNADLTKAQQAVIERKSIATKKRADLLATYKSWKRTPVIAPPMVDIPAGEFLMGSNLYDKEKPIHKVNVKAFKISPYEVTIKQFKQFAAATGFTTDDMCWKYVSENGGPYKDGIAVLPGNWLTPEYAPSDFHPVMCVSWDDANAYLAWLSQQTGKKYRLPTEAEWEYAARAGSSTKYSFGDNEKDVCHYGNTFDESGLRAFVRDKNYAKRDMACDDGVEYTSTVGMYKPNAFGVYDMIGNVSEWVADCDHENYQGAPTDGSAWISEKCYMRSRKGNTYGSNGGSHISMRGHGGQNNRSSLGEGFRIVEDMESADSCTTLSSSCKKIKDTSKEFEKELAEAQKRVRQK
ncbi:formylglycine-generating enzyme family protein [Cellvibrio zantedeschiae]|nr:SUMF1/EgtB/PvdO family nonheme iron enzyme [Cellvibrio zantedeschiae]